MKLIIFVIGFLSFQCLSAQDQMYDICPLKVGTELPEASVTNAAGESVALSTLTQEKPTVLVFYRGAWCGYCTKHLAELNDSKPDIEALGYQIIGITVDQADKLEASIAKAGDEIPVYSDARMEAISAFGLNWRVGDDMMKKYRNQYKLDLQAWSGEDHQSLPVPSIYVIQDGVVVFQYVNPNYRLRLKPATLLAVLATL